jgi:hypothetical protein
VSHRSPFEPFDAHTLQAIRTAFQAAWHELCTRPDVTESYTLLRNRLAGIIAHLASNGITDPFHLKEKALQKLASSPTLN